MASIWKRLKRKLSGGKVRTCRQCGAEMSPGVTKCPSCGFQYGVRSASPESQ